MEKKEFTLLAWNNVFGEISDKVLIKKKTRQNHHKFSHFSCLHITLHLHLLPNPQCITWAAITLCFSRKMPWSDKWDSKWYQAAGTQKDQTAQWLLYNVKRHWSEYLRGFLLYHFCQKAWPPEVWCGRTGTLGKWDLIPYDPPISQTNGDFSPLSGEPIPTPLGTACIFSGKDQISFTLPWDPSVVSKQSTTRLTRVRTNLLRVLPSNKAPPHPHQLKQDTAEESFPLENVKARCRTVSKNRAWEQNKSEVILNYCKKGAKQRIQKKRHLEKLISLIVKKEQCLNNGTRNTAINNNYFIKKWRNFVENQMPVSIHNGLEFWLQKEERNRATFCKGQYGEGLSPNWKGLTRRSSSM